MTDTKNAMHPKSFEELEIGARYEVLGCVGTGTLDAIEFVGNCGERAAIVVFEDGLEVWLYRQEIEAGELKIAS